jgi:hypothetical protein
LYNSWTLRCASLHYLTDAVQELQWRGYRMKARTCSHQAQEDALSIHGFPSSSSLRDKQSLTK